MAAIRLGDTVPNFHAESNQGPIDFHNHIDGSWAVLLSHPSDFTPVCTTELGSVGTLMGEFEKRGVKVVAISFNSVESHRAWIDDILAVCPDAGSIRYPIVADPARAVAVAWGMLDPEQQDADGMPFTARAVFVIGPDKKLKLSLLYPASTGRNFHELLRAIDSLQLTAKFGVATPVHWQPGGRCIVLPGVSDVQALRDLPKGFQTFPLPSGKGYLRYTPQPDLP